MAGRGSGIEWKEDKSDSRNGLDICPLLTVPFISDRVDASCQEACQRRAHR